MAKKKVAKIVKKAQKKKTIKKVVKEEKKPKEKVIKADSAFMEKKWVWAIVGIFILIFVVVILLAANKLGTSNGPELVLNLTESPDEEQNEEKEEMNLIGINNIKEHYNKNVELKGEIYVLKDVQYDHFISLLRDESGNDLFLIPVKEENYIPRENYIIKGKVKMLEVCGACQKMYVCDNSAVDPYNEIMNEEGWINVSMNGLPTPKVPLKHCIKENQSAVVVGYGECIRKYQCDPATFEEIYYINEAVSSLEE